MEQGKIPHPRSYDAVAARVGVSKGTLHNLRRSGILEITKVGRRTLITEEQEELMLYRLRVAKTGRTYDEQRYLESLQQEVGNHE